MRYRHAEVEFGAYFNFRLNLDRASKLLNEHLWDGQAKTHPALVYVAWTLQLTKELEKLFLFLLRDAYTWILNRSPKRTFLAIVLKLYRYGSSIGKLKGIANQIVDHLLVSLGIREYGEGNIGTHHLLQT